MYTCTRASLQIHIIFILSTQTSTPVLLPLVSMLFVFNLQITDNPEAVAKGAPLRSAPRIACFKGEQSQFFVFVEGETMCVVSSLDKAIVIWFAVHYILNLEYSTQVREVALFIQESVFGLPATSVTKKHKTTTYLVVSTEIKNYIED